MPSVRQLFSAATTPVTKGTGRNGLVSFELDTRRTVGALNKFVPKFLDFSQAHKQISIVLYGWVLRNFNSGGQLQSPTWAPLAASTIKQKARKGYSLSPLIRTGALKQSFEPFYDDTSAGVRSDSPIAKYHEGGTARMPRRSMLPPIGYARENSVKIFNTHIQVAKRESGL